MADFEIIIDNVWTYLKPKIEINKNLINQIESQMSYTIQEYNRFRKTFVDFDISLFERDTLRYPTGLYSVLDEILTKCGYTFDVTDARNIPNLQTPMKFHGKNGHGLRDYQEEVVEKAIKAQRGVIKIATGGGKTVIAAAIVAKMNLKTLFIVYSIDLLEQTADEFETMFQIKVGKIGGGYCEIERINICTVQTLHSAFGLKYDTDSECYIKEKTLSKVLERKEEIRQVVQEAEMIVEDECHKCTAATYVEMNKIMPNGFMRFGLCLYKFTKIHLADGKKRTLNSLFRFSKDTNNIINVLTFNTKTNIIEPKFAHITRVSAKNKNLLKLIFELESKETVEIICSQEHMFYLNDFQCFREAKSLKIGDKFNSIEKQIKIKCEICNEFLPDNRKRFCSNKCKSVSLKGKPIVSMDKAWKEWRESLSEDEKQRRNKLFQQSGTKKSAENSKFLTIDDRKKISEIRKKTCAKMKIEDPEKYHRMHHVKNFSDPEQVSKRSKKIWDTKSKEEKLRIITPMIIAGLITQNRLKREGVKTYCKSVKADDGHICDSKGEAIVDNWLFKNNILHEVHPNIPGTRCFADFKVQHEDKPFYLEYDGMDRNPYNKHKIYQDLHFHYLVLKRNDIANNFQLSQKLGFLLFKDPIATLISKIEIENNEDYLYDLSILDANEENQNFFANNILVHNSATPYRDTSIDRVLEAYTGKLICNINASYLIDKGYLVHPDIYILDPNEHTKYKFVKKSFRNIYENWITNNTDRNKMIVDCVLRLQDMGRTTLITVTRIPHGDNICEMLDKAGAKSIAFMKGEVDKETRKDLLNQIREKKLKVLIGTSLADEGLDMPALDAAILAGGGKSLIKSLQRIGRTLRPYPNAENNVKKEAIIVDFYDRLRYLTGHSKKRIKIYESEHRFKVYKHF